MHDRFHVRAEDCPDRDRHQPPHGVPLAAPVPCCRRQRQRRRAVRGDRGRRNLLRPLLQRASWLDARPAAPEPCCSPEYMGCPQAWLVCRTGGGADICWPEASPSAVCLAASSANAWAISASKRELSALKASAASRTAEPRTLLGAEVPKVWVWAADAHSAAAAANARIDSAWRLLGGLRRSGWK